ncbi:MAG: NAD+ synthase, partial [Bryobacter sp.]|nr:NAD+ synthase [Bryobacter sp.]
MKIALGQFNPTVGDLAGNANRMAAMAREAASRGARMVVFPELSLAGYPPRDLVEKPSFLERNEEELQRLAGETAGLPLAVVCGYVGRSSSTTGRAAQNAAAVLHAGEVIFRQAKILLPTYDVFDEVRYFQPAEKQALFTWEGRRIALTICEDAWNDKQYWERPLYQRDPVDELIRQGGEILLSINGSPYHMGKRALRREIFRSLARKHNVPVVYVHQVGGNDQLVFDGSSFALNAQGDPIAEAVSFDEDLVLVDLASGAGDRHPTHADENEAVYEALVVGTRDYIRKCGFRKVLIGLSGGIDSSLTAVVAVDAVGRENVTGVAMPGPYSSDHSLTD